MNTIKEQLVSSSAMDPLSFGQESLWFLAQLEPDSAHYNIPQAIRLRGALNVRALREAFETILERHESLRTRIVSVADKPMQFSVANEPFNLPVIDLTPLSDSDREREMESRLKEETQRPFDLAKDLMLRASLLRLRDDEHLLLVTVHHIAADAWSFRLLHEELAVLYETFCSGKPSPLPEPEFQFADFAVYQRELFQGEFAEKQIAYWKKRLEGELPILKLPTDHPVSTRRNFRGALRRFKLPGVLRESLKDFCRREKMTAFSVSLAAFQILLHRYSRQDDILVGCPISTRNHPRLESLVGYFVNTIAMRGDLSGNPAIRKFLSELNGHVIAALSHPDVPLERLAEELNVPRQPGRNPLVQVCFQYLAEPPEAPKFSGLETELLSIDPGISKFDLSLVLNDDAEGLIGELEYRTDLFEPTTIDRMIGHYETLLESILRNSAQKISELPLLTSAEKQQLLVEWNNAATDFPREISLVELFEKQAAANPDSIAVECEQEQLTWRELNGQTNRLARHLKKLGVQSGKLVGICMERSVEMLVAVHGILKTGAAFFPLDPEYPQERLHYLLQDAQAAVVLCQNRFGQIVSSEKTKIICLDRDLKTFADESPENLETKPGPEDLAYVIYTSGSTGQPKGVMVQHRALCNHLFWMQSRFPLTREERILQKASFSFDVAVWEIFAPIISGSPLVMAKPGGHRDTRYLAELIAEKNIAILQTTPSALRALIAEPELKNCHALKYVLCGGEEMPADLPAQFFRMSKAIFCNSYGPTEATIDSAFWICNQRDERDVVPIGRPIANAEIYLLDAYLQPVPIGVPGELCVGGRGLACGYWRRPELTAEKFIRHPFSNDPAARLYKTGDLARFRENGDIEFLGRIDQQVKIRGFRIEPGEIESLLRNCSGVREAAVVSQRNPAGENYLAAYWVAAHGSTATDAQLRASLKSKVPEFMVPAVFVQLDSLPLSANGKIDRAALPRPDFSPDASRYVPPRTWIEKHLAEIWAELLRLERVGVHDDFFELGGHSLLATQVVSRMRALHGGELTLREFFEAPTIAELSLRLQQKGASDSAKTDFEIKPLPRNAAGAVLGLLQILEPGLLS